MTMRNHQTSQTKARGYAMLRQVTGAGYSSTGVNKDAVRANAANDEIAEALAEIAARKANAAPKS
jgi:hypothetical protein